MSSSNDFPPSSQPPPRDKEQNIYDDHAIDEEYAPKQFAYLEDFFSHASDGILLIDFTGTFVDANRVALNITGYEREELLGNNLFALNLLPEDQIAFAARLLNQDIISEPSGPDILMLNRKDGGTIPVEIRAYPYQHNNRSLVLGVVKDISAPQQHEQTPSQGENRFRTIFFDSPIGIAIFDADLVLQHTNRAWLELFGVGSQFTSPGISLLDDILMSEETKKKIQNREPVRFETAFDFSSLNSHNDKRSRQGGKSGTLHLDFQISRFGQDRKEAAAGFLVHVQNITARKVAEEMLRKAHDHLDREVRQRTAHLRETNAALEILLDERKRRTVTLGETNTALKVMLDERQVEKQTFKETILQNLQELALPFLKQLQASGLSREQEQLAEVLDRTLQEIMAPLILESPLEKLPLTRTEVQVAKLIQNQYTTKDIAKIFDTSLRTIERHRYNLRKKLGLTNKKQNLRSFLLMMNELYREPGSGAESE